MTQKQTLRNIAATTPGADILMARHGSHIMSWRVDHRTDSTVALLDDGRWVSVRNHLDLPRATPGQRVVAGWAAYKTGQAALKPSDVHWMAKLTGWWLLGTAAFTGGAFALVVAVS
ncbi:MAG: hypothetical protein ACTIJJ_01355 [Galactobacter sp.]